jgi:hypothetical protein
VRTERWNSNNRKYIVKHRSGAEAHISALVGQAKEMVGWFDRIDNAIDNTATLLGLDQIPYGVDTEYCIKNDIGYNTAYRMELLYMAVKERKHD